MRVKGCCPLDCQDSCAWEAEVESDSVVRVTGSRDHPITRGVLCTKVKDFEQRITAPGRLLHPLKRVGAKGSGQFERISWDQALDEIATRFTSIINEHGAEALMPFCYLGSQGVVQRLAPMRLFHALGASLPVGGLCAVSAMALMNEGHPIGVDPEETPNAKLIIVWGQNVLTTCHHQWHFIDAARKQGARIVAIDPCLTRTAQQCDVYLAPRPGTDVILAAAIGRHLLASGQADLDLAAKWVGDLDQYRATVEPWTFAAAARETDVTADNIQMLAEAFATAQPALIRAGIAPAQARNGDDFVRSLSALAILGGHWRHDGGGLSILSMPQLNEARAARSDLIKGKPRSLDIARLGEILEATDRPVKGLMVWTANPAATQIDGPRVKRGLARDDLFTVVAEHFLTDTARYADIVLPATTQFEHVDVQGAWGHHYVMANAAAIAPRGEARSSGAIMRGLAQRMGRTHPALLESDEEIAQSALPEGWSFLDLLQSGWRKSPTPRPSLQERSEKLSITFAAIPVPQLEEGHLQLLTPKSHYFMNSTFANTARHQTQQGPAAVHLNPADATARGFNAGDVVVLRAGSGAVTVPVVIDANIRAGVATLEGKWWEEGNEANPAMNRLSSSLWAPSGQPAFNEIYVLVERA